MKRIRQRDSIIYVLASGLAFALAFTTHHTLTTIHLFLLGALDAYILENAQDIYRLSRMRLAWR